MAVAGVVSGFDRSHVCVGVYVYVYVRSNELGPVSKNEAPERLIDGFERP